MSYEIVCQNWRSMIIMIEGIPLKLSLVQSETEGEEGKWYAQFCRYEYIDICDGWEKEDVEELIGFKNPRRVLVIVGELLLRFALQNSIEELIIEASNEKRRRVYKRLFFAQGIEFIPYTTPYGVECQVVRPYTLSSYIQK